MKKIELTKIIKNTTKLSDEDIKKIMGDNFLRLLD